LHLAAGENEKQGTTDAPNNEGIETYYHRKNKVGVVVRQQRCNAKRQKKNDCDGEPPNDERNPLHDSGALFKPDLWKEKQLCRCSNRNYFDRDSARRITSTWSRSCSTAFCNH
jgi:hypothetical protein